MKKPHQYWDLSINPVWHTCTKVTVGCEHCWAKAMGKRFPEIRKIVECPKPELHLEAFNKLDEKKSQVVFLHLLGDLFHEDISIEWIDKVFKKCEEYYSHRFLICTKRVLRMREYFCYLDVMTNYTIPDNLYLGVSVEDQSTLWRIEELAKIPHVKKWVSFEPLLNPVDLRNTIRYRQFEEIFFHYIDFVVIGCETGSKRLCYLSSIQSLINDIRYIKNNIPIWVKQIPLNGKSCNKIELFPKDLQIRELPFKPKERRCDVNLIKSIQEELDRNRELLKEYKQIPQGQFGAIIIENRIKEAENAIATGDTVKMLYCYNQLQESQ